MGAYEDGRWLAERQISDNRSMLDGPYDASQDQAMDRLEERAEDQARRYGTPEASARFLDGYRIVWDAFWYERRERS